MAVEQLKAEILTWQSALSAHDAGDFRASLHLFEPIADTAKIFVNVALIHDRLGERALAIENLSRAIELDKYLAIGYLQRGVYFFHGGQYAEALQDFSDAQAMMRTNLEIDYDMLGLQYKLKLQEILFNKLLALLRLGNKKEGLVILQTIIAGSPPPDLAAKVLRTEHSVVDAVPVSLPIGTLFRPTAGRLELLKSAIAAQAMHDARSAADTSPKLPESLCTASSDTDASSTFAPSVSSRKAKEYGKHRSSISSATFKASSSISEGDSEISASRVTPKRTELSRVVGADMMTPMNEISSIPCAGVRISHGHLSGLMAWRFVLRLDGSGSKRSVVTNFILDTGNKDTYIPPEALTALGYRGKMTPGAEVTLRVQSVKTKCIVARPDDAGRIGLSFMTAGALTYYFDAGLVAPVLYDGSGERPSNVPRTIRAEDLPRRGLLAILRAWFGFGRGG